VVNPSFELTGAQFGWQITAGDANGDGDSGPPTSTVTTTDPSACHSGIGCVLLSDKLDLTGQVYTIQQTITGITPGSFLEASFFVTQSSPTDGLDNWSVQMLLDNSFTVNSLTGVQGGDVMNIAWTQESSSGLYQETGDTVTVTIIVKNQDEFGPAVVGIDDVFVAVTCNPPALNE
jgi:hypothetical protein